MITATVSGAAGFIGSHLVKRLVLDGYHVRAVDIKYPEFEPSLAHEFILGDLRGYSLCKSVTQDVEEVYHLASNMGGIGYITMNHAGVAHDNVRIDSNMLCAAQDNDVQMFLFSSSACVYPSFLQQSSEVTPLKEEDAYPADPEPGYGWAKLFTEQLCAYYAQDYGLPVRIARFHNCFGPSGTFEGGKEKAPAALCRKVVMASDPGELVVWGDGKQTRSFVYVDDCVEGIVRLARSEYDKPLNIGSDRLISIGDLAEMVIRISGKSLKIKYDLSGPQGVRGRNSDNTRMREVLQWEPRTSLEDGMAITYSWIDRQLRRRDG